jgi:hypothetical protein
MRYLPPLLGHIPKRIDDPCNPLLHGFPVNVSFPRIHWAEGADEHEIDIQSYRLTYDTFWPDPDSSVAFRVCSGRFLAMGYYKHVRRGPLGPGDPLHRCPALASDPV